MSSAIGESKYAELENFIDLEKGSNGANANVVVLKTVQTGKNFTVGSAVDLNPMEVKESQTYL